MPTVSTFNPFATTFSADDRDPSSPCNADLERGTSRTTEVPQNRHETGPESKSSEMPSTTLPNPPCQRDTQAGEECDETRPYGPYRSRHNRSLFNLFKDVGFPFNGKNRKDSPSSGRGKGKQSISSGGSTLAASMPSEQVELRGTMPPLPRPTPAKPKMAQPKNWYDDLTILDDEEDEAYVDGPTGFSNSNASRAGPSNMARLPQCHGGGRTAIARTSSRPSIPAKTELARTATHDGVDGARGRRAD